ncbi:MAG: dienelactone hydrolase family protein [Verrucomicrobiota bacterium]
MTFLSGADEVAGFLTLPPFPGRHRAVIAIHEWWGLTGWVKEQAINLAANGYVVLAVDLYRGRVASTRSEARELKRRLSATRAIGDLKAAFDYLAARSDVDAKYIASIGWSMGGSFALQQAIHEPRLAACVVNYGALPTSRTDIQKINAPVLGHFGALDRGIPPRKVRTFEKVMNLFKKPVDIKIYDGAGHAFENPNNKRGYRQSATADAWNRTLSFYARARTSKI